MIQVFKCPSCGASLSYEGGPAPTITCQFCGATVAVPEELRTQPGPASRPESAPTSGLDLDGALSGLPLDKLGELKQLAQSGQKIEAIKLYRELFPQTGLAEAKEAVEKLEAGQPLVFTSTTIASSDATEAGQAGRLAEIGQLARAGQKIEAIKLFRAAFGVGLKEAKDAVEAMEAGQSADVSQFPVQSPRASADRATRLAEVMELAHAGRKIEAIKLYREIYGVGLKEAKDAVEAMDTGTGRPVPVAQARRAVRTLGCATTALIVLCGVGFAGFVLAMVFGVTFRMSGSYRQALAAAQSDPAVIEALGVPVEASFGVINGSLSCSSGACHADYTIPIHGSKKSGRLRVTSYSQGATFGNDGTWTLSAWVVVDGGAALTLATAPTPAPTLSVAQVDATAGAEARATKIAQATADARATATERAVQAATATAETEATAQAIENATATAEAQATATAVSLILTSQQAWPVAFADPFTDNGNGWHTGDITETGLTAQRRIADGQYVWDITSQSDIFWSTWPDRGKVFDDFYASVEAKVLVGGAVPSYGLVFRLADENDFYYFGLNDDGYYRFDVYQGGQNTGLPIVYGTDAVHKGGVNRLAVSASGPHFILLVNDQVAGVFDDDQFDSGEIGLGMTAYEQGGEASVVFDNFEVHAPK